MIQNYVILLIALAILYYLNKKGIINVRFPPLRIGYVTSYSTKKFHSSYVLYNQINKHELIVKPEKPVTLTYDVSVARGSLLLKVINNNEVVFEKKFKANMDEEDVITFTPKSRLLMVRTIGYYTTGGCDVNIIERK